MLPTTRNETKFFSVKQVLAEFDELTPMASGLTTLPFNLSIEPNHKKPPTFYLGDLPIREASRAGQSEISESQDDEKTN